MYANRAVLIAVVAIPLMAQGPLAQRKGRSAAPASNPAVAGHLSQPQQANIERLKSDVAAIQGKSQVTPQMKQQLSDDLMSMANGATRPSPAAVQKLATDLAAALTDQKLSQREIAQLTADLNKVLNSANIPTDEFTAIIGDVKTILSASNVSKADLQLIAGDLQAIGAELKSNTGAVIQSGQEKQRVRGGR